MKTRTNTIERHENLRDYLRRARREMNREIEELTDRLREIQEQNNAMELYCSLLDENERLMAENERLNEIVTELNLQLGDPQRMVRTINVGSNATCILSQTNYAELKKN